MEERVAIERLRNREIRALEYLVKEYQVRALRTANLVTRDLALAQDVVQDAFLKAYERIDQFDVSRPFAPWFLTCVLRDAVKACRKRGRQRSFEELADSSEILNVRLGDQSVDPEALFELAETAEDVQVALAALTPEQRSAVVARYYLGLSEAEMAEALACRPSTVKWRLYSARQRLRLLLNPISTDT